ncbi:MAG: hypothetical protein ACAH21_12645 [Ramlibacter sp.]|nr:hypothetical protein [Ramlibacter sp.]
MSQALFPPSGRSEFLGSVQKGLLLGAALLAVLLPPATGIRQPAPTTPQAITRMAAPAAPPRLADFGDFKPTEDVRQLANWTVHVGDHQGKSFVIIDKKDARVYVFGQDGRLKSAAPVLLGSAIGDDNAPGIGQKAIADVLPEEKTTPTGRYEAQMGMNTRGEDVVWVDYDAAVSMHRVLTTNPAERRLERLATPDVADNRISYGCINVPRDFYEQVLAATVKATGAIIYVLPETRGAQQVFGSWDVERGTRLAQR